MQTPFAIIQTSLLPMPLNKEVRRDGAAVPAEPSP